MVSVAELRILALGLNPAVQNTMVFSEFRKGEVNRAVKREVFAGGKGANFARAVRNWGGACVVAQFTGGATGAEFNDCLKVDGIECLNQEVEASTRTCSTLLCSKTHTMTEVIEPSGAISSGSIDALAAKIAAELPKCSGVALCGTWPPGVDASFYARTAELAAANGAPVLLDAFKDVDMIISGGHVEILKINADELGALAGDDDIRSAGVSVLERFPVKYLAITDGPREAWLFTRSDVSRLRVPRIESPLNPIGAGDTVSAVLFAEYLTGTPIHEAFARGLKAASESCLNLKPAQFTWTR